MKTLKVIMLAVSVIVCGSAFAQSAKTDTKTSTFFVQLPHTPEQCMNTMKELGDQGDAMLSNFEFGCHSGDHTAYGFIKGVSAESVRNSLPAALQKTAKIEKVDKYSADELKKMHQEQM